jgi:hypothetical protein
LPFLCVAAEVGLDEPTVCQLDSSSLSCDVTHATAAATAGAAAAALTAPFAAAEAVSLPTVGAVGLVAGATAADGLTAAITAIAEAADLDGTAATGTGTAASDLILLGKADSIPNGTIATLPLALDLEDAEAGSTILSWAALRLPVLQRRHSKGEHGESYESRVLIRERAMHMRVQGN